MLMSMVMVMYVAHFGPKLPNRYLRARPFGMVSIDSSDAETLEKIAEAEIEIDKLVRDAAGAEEDVAIEDADEVQVALEAAIEGKLDIRSSLGQKFSRSSDGGKSKVYRAATSRAAKKAFQTKWCELQLSSHTATKDKIEDFRKVDKSKGTYKSFRQLAVKEGVEKAKLYSSKCAQLRGSWVLWDAMYEHWTFFEIERTFSQVFTRSWSLHVQSSSSSSTPTPSTTTPAVADNKRKRVEPRSAAGAPQQADKETAAAPTLQKNDEPDDAPADGKGDAGQKGDKAKGDKAKGGRAQTPEQKAKAVKAQTPEQKATKTKVTYMATLSSCDNLLNCIGADASWAWANNDTQLESIRAAKATVLETIRASQFTQDFMTLKTTDVAKKYSADLAVQCGHMSHTLDHMLSKLARETAALVQMKVARDMAFSK